MQFLAVTHFVKSPNLFFEGAVKQKVTVVHRPYYYTGKIYMCNQTFRSLENLAAAQNITVTSTDVRMNAF